MTNSSPASANTHLREIAELLAIGYRRLLSNRAKSVADARELMAQCDRPVDSEENAGRERKGASK